MLKSILPILGVVVMAGVGVLGDYFIKISGSTDEYISIRYFLVGMAIYTLTAVGWFFVMKYIKISSLGIIYSVSTAILLALVGFIFFKEDMKIANIIAIVLGIISIVILAKN